MNFGPILNPWTVSALFMASVGLVLALVALAVASRVWAGARNAATRSSLEVGEDRAHLLVIVVAVLGLVRFLAWPHFYLLLKSYVPALEQFGVMCAFGVTRIERPLVATLEWSKPLVLAGFGFWWLLVLLERRSHDLGLARARNSAAIVLALAAAAECVLEIVYLLREKGGRPITCCTQFLDTETTRGAASVALPAFGSFGGNLALYIAMNALVAGLAFVAARAPAARSRWRARAESLALATLGLANLFVAYCAWLAVVAPRVLGLPYHHCIYELVTDTPMLGFAAVLACAGTACLVWPLGLGVWMRRAPEAVERLQRTVYSAGALCIASSTSIVLVHVL